ncbi:purine phosphorylase [Dactylosporangium sp. NPDC000521]|uniref:5'-methylthioadenosine/S-adenosylhomocysteine nucleosidase family protein n=1 Tax=Dactylosporangium sp. NPDC000521 TaxID=3363975 RepID=UPI0036CF0436
MSSDLVVVLTALNLEYEAVRARLRNPRVHRHQAGTRFEVGRIGQDGCRIALGLVGKGNHPAAVLAERAMAEFSPAAVLFTGVAGALWPSIQLGDVVVATQVYAYHGATSEDDGLKARPRAWEIPHHAAQIALHIARSNDWADGLADGVVPRIHFGPIAAGEVVQDSAVSDQARWVRQHYNDALAIEMEGAGVAQAGHLNRATPVVVVRGISDRADGTKTVTDGVHWQPRAAAHAAAFTVALAQELADEGTDNQSTTGQMGGRARMEATTTNMATGNARVGIQAGQIRGNAVVGLAPEQPGDLAAAITELRGLVEQARRDGRLDDATTAAAEAELNTADDCIDDGAVRNRNSLLVALKRLLGLVTDVAELATRLPAVIGAVRDLT